MSRQAHQSSAKSKRTAEFKVIGSLATIIDRPLSLHLTRKLDKRDRARPLRGSGVSASPEKWRLSLKSQPKVGTLEILMNTFGLQKT